VQVISRVEVSVVLMGIDSSPVLGHRDDADFSMARAGVPTLPTADVGR